MTKRFILFVSYVLIIACVSPKFIDSEIDKELIIGEGKLYSMKNFNIFEYRPKVIMTKDTKQYKPMSFKVKLPKGIVHYIFINATEFYFFYPDQQIVYIKLYPQRLDLPHTNILSSKPKNSIFSKPSIDKLIEILNTNDEFIRKRYRVTYKMIKASKYNFLKQNKDYELLLFNLKEQNQSIFKKYLSSLEILEQ